MFADEIRELFLSYPETTESTPFGPNVLVYKVAGKMFSLIGMDEVPPRVNLKCDPDKALELRDHYDEILPGYHMNKKHWNTVVLEDSLPDDLIREMVEDSFQLVVAGMPAKDRLRFG